MTDIQIGFLYKAASTLQRVENSSTLTLLQSYYLMRCKDITKGHGLPERQFSSKVRCSKCCIEWKKGSEIKVKAIKLSKKQRQRIRAFKANKDNKELVKNKLELLNSNEVVKICTVCKQSTTTLAKKPEKLKLSKKQIEKLTDTEKRKSTEKNIQPTALKKKAEEVKSNKVPAKKKKLINVYSNSTEVFSLNNKINTLPSTQKEEAKVIKNNKKKKDKFAGLCQKAVLATAKLKEEKQKQNKLNLFLRPST